MTRADIIRQHINDDVYTLSVQDGWCENYDKKWLVLQIQARQKAKSKLPSWYGNFDLLFPPPLSVEQCSSELAARYKASLIDGGTLVDMTGGMGIDASAFAARCNHVTFFEKQDAVADAARHNFNALGISNMEVINGDSTQLISTLPNTDHIYLDPARRKEGQKVFRLEDCEPDLLTLMPVLTQKTSHLIVKLSPLFDLTLLRQQLRGITAIHIVAVHNEVKELLVEMGTDVADCVPAITCVNLEADGQRTWTWSEERASVTSAFAVPTSGEFLYEPHPTVMKSGLMDAMAAQYGMAKLHPHSHLYTSKSMYSDFFGRIFKIESVFGMGKAELKAGLGGTAKANITVRNFPLSAEVLRHKIKIADGGDVTLFATTLADGKKVILKTVKA